MMMPTMRTLMLAPVLALAAATMAGCGSEGDPTVHRAAERCVEQAQGLTGNLRSTAEAGCGKMQTYCNTAARVKEPLCQQFLLRYK